MNSLELFLSGIILGLIIIIIYQYLIIKSFKALAWSDNMIDMIQIFGYKQIRRKRPADNKPVYPSVVTK